MKINEQPVRFLAIFIFAPYIIYCGYKYNNLLLLLFGIIFFFYELFWICFYKPKIIDFNSEPPEKKST